MLRTFVFGEEIPFFLSVNKKKSQSLPPFAVSTLTGRRRGLGLRLRLLGEEGSKDIVSEVGDYLGY